MLVYDNDGIMVYCRIMLPDASSRLEQSEAERAAVRMLIAEAFPHRDAPVLCHHPTGAPFLEGVDAAVSVSHCRGCVCVALGSSDCRIGIDAESCMRGAQLRRVARKFLSPRQLAGWGVDETRLLRAWTVKEAVYKTASVPGLRLHEIPLPDVLEEEGGDVLLQGRCYEIKPLEVSGFGGMVTLAIGKTADEALSEPGKMWG